MKNNKRSNVRKTTEQFIEEARQVHGNKFDYSKVEFVNNHTKICVICPEHGEFWQTPNDHLRGHGCPKCSGNVKLIRSIIEERFLKYCNLHNYELVSINTFDKRLKDIKATCHCPIHNEDFTITLSSVSYRENINAMKCKGCRSDRQKENKNFYRYTKEEVLNTRKKYSTLQDFRINEPGLYSYANRNNIKLDLEHVGNKYNRCIYCYKFNINNEKYIYVGLTHDIFERDKQHKKSENSSVLRFSKVNNVEIPQIEQLTDYLPKDEASKKEGELLTYFCNNGYKKINKATCGGLGGGRLVYIPSEEEIREKTKKYKTITDFRKNEHNIYYQTMRRLNLTKVLFPPKNITWSKEMIEEIVSHYDSFQIFKNEQPNCYDRILYYKLTYLLDKFPDRKKTRNNFTKDYILELFKKVKDSKEFIEKYPSEYYFMRHQKICFPDSLKDKCHRQRRNDYGKTSITFEHCQQLINKFQCKSRTDFNKKCPYEYKVALKYKWLDKLFGEKLIKHNYYTYEICRNICNESATIKEIQIKFPRCYQVIRKNGWDELLPKSRRQPLSYERCYEVAKKYNSKKEFIKNHKDGEYRAARKNGWIKDYTWLKSCHHNWEDVSLIKQEASKYKTKSEFHDGCRSAYDNARKKGILDSLFPHRDK